MSAVLFKILALLVVISLKHSSIDCRNQRSPYYGNPSRQANTKRSGEKYTVEIVGGPSAANDLAHAHGCNNLGLVRGFNNIYLFEKKRPNVGSTSARRHKRGLTRLPVSSSLRTRRGLESEPAVKWVDPQEPMVREKRDFRTLEELYRRQNEILSEHKTRRHLFNQPFSSSYPHLLSMSPNPKYLHKQYPALASANKLSSTARIDSQVGRLQQQVQQAKQVALPASSERAMFARPNTVEEISKFNDELWMHQWYLQDNSNVAQLHGEVELKVEDVWKMGYSGKGVVVTILDDGLEHNHTDIKQNYDPRASFDMNNNQSNPFPRYDSADTNNHGTRCAGEVAMIADNRKCGVGVAPRARIGGIKCLDGEVLDHVESMSLLHNMDYIDIYSGSWGPTDNGQVVDGPKRLASQALERGTRLGRKGKGALYVWANGNGGGLGDNCNCDGYVNSIYTISIGGVTQQGQIPFYGEKCASTLAVTCSSGAYADRKIVTTDLHNKCTIDYTGTSAAAPLAAGVLALALEANGNLTWRDAQHLIAWTSDPIPLRDNPGWRRNSAGLLFNSRFGFGLMNARSMVHAALTWQTVPRKSVCTVQAASALPRYLESRSAVQIVFASDGCQREFERMTPALASIRDKQQQPTPVAYLEHVQVIVDIEYSSRGSLDIFLVSPSGTVSSLLSRRPLDTSRQGFDKWPLMSVHFWGELAAGKWTLVVRDKNSNSNRGLISNVTLLLHGTSQRPAHMSRGPRVYGPGSEKMLASTSRQPQATSLDSLVDFDEEDLFALSSFAKDSAFLDSFEPSMLVKSLDADDMHHQASLQF